MMNETRPMAAEADMVDDDNYIRLTGVSGRIGLGISDVVKDNGFVN